MALSIMTLSIMALSIITLSIMTLCIMTRALCTVHCALCKIAANHKHNTLSIHSA